MTISTCLEISTANISQHGLVQLAAIAKRGLTLTTQSGQSFMIRIHENVVEDFEEFNPFMSLDGSLVDALIMAQTYDVWWLYIDPDADILHQLNTYDHE